MNVSIISNKIDFVSYLKKNLDSIINIKADNDLIDLLGWNEETLKNFIESKDAIVTIPHASPNVFFPRAGVCWHARHIQDQENIFHLRIILSHNNFSDSGWKPYAWWLFDDSNNLIKNNIVSRNNKYKHNIIKLSDRKIVINKDKINNLDDYIYKKIININDLDIVYMLIMSYHENICGFTKRYNTLYITFDLLLSFIKDIVLEKKEYLHIKNIIKECSVLRRFGDDGNLIITNSYNEANIFDNITNISLIQLITKARFIGGNKMNSYWDSIIEKINLFNLINHMYILEYPKLIISNYNDINYNDIFKLDKELINQLDYYGIGYSQGMAAYNFGNIYKKFPCIF